MRWAWFTNLQMLAARIGAMGFTADLSVLTLASASGLLMVLKRLVEVS